MAGKPGWFRRALTVIVGPRRAMTVLDLRIAPRTLTEGLAMAGRTNVQPVAIRPRTVAEAFTTKSRTVIEGAKIAPRTIVEDFEIHEIGG